MRLSISILLLALVVPSAVRGEPARPELLHKVTVSRVFDPEAKLDAAAVKAAIRAIDAGIDVCPRRPGTFAAWLAFEDGKVALADVAGTDDRAAAACIGTIFKKATLVGSKGRVATLVELRFLDVDTAMASVDTRGLGIGVVTSGGRKGVGSGTVSGSGKAAAGEPKLDKGGSLTRDEIRHVINARAGVYRACYETEADRNPDLAGKLVYQLTIGADGGVTSAELTSSTMTGGDAVAACLKSNLAKLRFPSKGGAVVSYPFVFANE